jgi:hypothetical protein
MTTPAAANSRMSFGIFCQISERDILTVANKIHKSEILLIEHPKPRGRSLRLDSAMAWI